MASIAQDVGSSSTDRSSNIMHRLKKFDKYQHVNKTVITVSGPSIQQTLEIVLIEFFFVIISLFLNKQSHKYFCQSDRQKIK